MAFGAEDAARRAAIAAQQAQEQAQLQNRNNIQVFNVDAAERRAERVKISQPKRQLHETILQTTRTGRRYL